MDAERPVQSEGMPGLVSLEILDRTVKRTISSSELVHRPEHRCFGLEDLHSTIPALVMTYTEVMEAYYFVWSKGCAIIVSAPEQLLIFCKTY